MKILYLACMRALARAEDAVCYAGLLLCTGLTVAAVINRYFFHFEVMWLNDLALYLYIPTGICCIAATARADAHTAVDVFVDIALKGRPVAFKIFKIIITLLVLAIFAYFIPLAFGLFATAWRYPEWGTLFRWYNTSWNREFLFVCIALSGLHTLHNLAVHLAELRAMLRARSAASEGEVKA
jgi:TRAP-type C4-dicarboxylate transport system permease small subunit